MGNTEAAGQQPQAGDEQPSDEISLDPESRKHDPDPESRKHDPDPESRKHDPDAPPKTGTGDVPPATKFQP